MAKQKKVILSGRAGNVIFYEFRGIPCSRTMPVKVRQTRATKASGKAFGKAATLAKFMRWGLVSVLPDAKNKSMILRLNTAVGQWVREGIPGKTTALSTLPLINQFQFNEETTLNERLKVGIQVDFTKPGKVLVTIPQLDPEKAINAPANTKTIHLKIAVTGISVDPFDITGNYSTSLDIEYIPGFIPEKKLQLPFTVTPGTITVVAAAISYELKNSVRMHPSKQSKWTPAAIVGSCYGQPG